jgi:hypothetical protein
MFGAVVDGGALLNVIWVSAVAGVGLTIVFSLTIAGAARASHHRREGQIVAAGAWAVIAALCALVCAATVVVGVTVMLHD